MRRYFLRHALALSFYAPALYRDAGRNWRGIGLAYLAGVLLLCWLPTWLQMHVEITTYLDEVVPEILRQVPAIRITGGEAFVEGPQPCEIREPRSGKLIAVLDTTGQTPELDAAGPPILLTRTKLIFRQPERSETRVQELKDFEGLHLDRTRLGHWAGLVRKWYAWLLYPAILGVALGLRLVQVAWYAGVGLLVCRSLRVRLGFAALMRVAAVAITPTLLLGTALDWAGAPLPWLFGFLLEMMYLVLGIQWNRQEPQPAVTAPGP